MKCFVKSEKFVRRAVIAVIAAALIIASVVCAGAFSAYKNNGSDREEYRLQLTEIYKKYNTDLAYEKYQSGEEFAFSRLLVYGTGGKTYGAASSAYDAEYDFSVLQYSTPEAAKKAYYKIQSDGLIADAEGVGELCSDTKGDLYPDGSNALGTPQYLSKYAMGSDDVIVAVVDTGVMYDHEALAGRFVNNGYDFSADACENAYFDTSKSGNAYGHATFVAGIIADNTPDSVKLLPYKVVSFGASYATSSSMISAVNDAVSQGATVINVSITSASSGNSFRTAIKNAFNNGVCVCAAAGNQSKEIKAIYPAGIEETITVSAVEDDFNTFADFSNYGSLVDFCAPGRNIVSLAPYTSPNENKTRINSGTSFSSPYVAAICADLKTVNNSMSVEGVCSVLRDFAADLGDAGKDDYFGWGMPDISDISYTDGESYAYSIPEGTLNVYGTKDYTADTQPWKLFADKLVSVNISDSVERIGDYNFYNVKSATFTKADTYDKTGDYAFFGCENVKSATFTENCQEVGTKAFGDIDGFTVYGYRNTPAETYALNENVAFVALGCRHNYLVDIIDPTETEEGYTVYTCTVCGDSYRGGYITPEIADSGQCGESLYYTYYDIGKLTISGSGEMYPYTEAPAPWSEYADSINTIEIVSSECSVSPFSFYGCSSVVKIRCSASNENYTVSDNVLYSKDMKTLVFMPKISGAAYVMPDSVENISAPAFIAGAANAITFNSNFNAESGIVYDANGNIVLALPSYKDGAINIDENIGISDYAFILTPHPDTVNADALGIDFGQCCIGYEFDGTLKKRDVTFCTYDSGSAKQYAENNGFTLSTYNKGRCGDGIIWYFDTSSQTLTLSGEGEMYSYSSAQEIPWSNYTSSIKEVVIGDGITALSDYSFYNATALRKLTMPLSLKAARNNTMWYSCSSIKTVILTQGSGYTDDYADENVTYYSYSPWYVSRNSVTSMTISEDALYIGREAFRGCKPLKSVTLKKCKKIAQDAFVSCTALNSFTLLSKDCEIADWSLFAYKISVYGIYKNPVMYAYDDSTAKDYCNQFGANFVSVGCGHSRNTELISGEIHTCCYDSVYNYHCNDCEGDFTEYVHTTDGHYVSGRLTNLEGAAIAGSDVYIDGLLCAVSGADGAFVAEDIKCGAHTVQFKKQSAVFLTADLTVDKSNTTGDFSAAYGDYNADGIVNGRDLAFAKTNSIDDSRLFDWGEPSAIVNADTPYAEQQFPHAQTGSFESVEGSDYQKSLKVKIINDSEYTITAAGFLYGKELDENDLVIEKANTYAENGNKIRIAESVEINTDYKVLNYGLKSKTSWFGIRFYIIYTNGVDNHIYYSDAKYYSYGDY